MRNGLPGAVVVAVALLLGGGCARVDAPPVRGLRTDPDGQGLVATYLGGSCDGTARLVVTETAERVDVRVAVTPLPDTGGRVCDDVGHRRSVGARLRQPLGTRSVFSGGRQQAPFAGTRLLVPTAGLPAGYTRVLESGTSSAAGSADPAARTDVTDGWTTTYAAPPSGDERSCRAGTSAVTVRVGPASDAAPTDGWSPVSTAHVGAADAGLLRTGSTRAPSGWAYAWTSTQGRVEVSSRRVCPGDRLVPAAELLRVARALVPA